MTVHWDLSTASGRASLSYQSRHRSSAVELSIRNRVVVGSIPTGGSPVRSPLRLGALTAACWLWAPTVDAQAPTEPVPPCPQRWIYEPPPTTAFVAPPFVSDSAGDFFWWEQARTPQLVAVRDGKMRWRRQLSPRPWPGLLSAALMSDDRLVVVFGSTVEGRRTSDGQIVWSRDLRADLSSELRRAGLARTTELETSTAARVGRALVTATATSATDGWLTAIAANGRRLWKAHIDRPVARMAADGDRLYMLPSLGEIGKPAIIVVDSNGKETLEPGVPFRDSMAVTGGEVVFDDGRVVTAVIAPMPVNCPPKSPSCHPPPFLLTVTGFTAGQEHWHLTSPPGSMRVQIMLLSDGSVLLVDDKRVGTISPDGTLSPLCELPVERYRSIAGLVHGDLVVAYFDSVAAYTLPGAPQLATAGWVMSGGGPAQEWAVRAAPAAPFVPFPAGVADSAGRVAYVQTDAGATIALALADGTVTWRTSSPARPVGSWRGRVIVLEQRNTLASALQVAQVDPVTGADVATSQPIPLVGLPDWAGPPLAPWGSPLATDVRIEGDRARISWEIAINGWPGGAEIRPYSISGLADVDLTSGAVTLAPVERVEGAKPGSSPRYPFVAVLGGRKFTLLYAATATLTATGARTGKAIWSRRLWSSALPPTRIPPP